MSIYVLLANLSNIKSNPPTGKSPVIDDVNEEVLSAGANLISQFDDFQHYDLVDVIEAANGKIVAKAITSLIARRLIRDLNLMGPYESRQYGRPWYGKDFNSHPLQFT